MSSFRLQPRASLLACAAFVFLGLSGCGSTSSTTSSGLTAQTGQAQPVLNGARLQETLDDSRAKMGFPGAVAGVWSPQGTWFGVTGTRGQGLSDAPNRGDYTRIGSLTKTMTATILLQLTEEGLVSLDDPISKYVTGTPNGNASLRQVATMSSGIPSYTESDSFQTRLFADPTQPWTSAELLSYIQGTPPDFAPGQGWHYSNSNYVLLGMVIEQVTGQSLAQDFQARIFGPLGMTHSQYPGTSTDIPDPHMVGVTNQGQPNGQTADATHWNPSLAGPAGEVISTFDDLYLWSQALFTGNGILRPETQQLRRNSLIYSIPPDHSPTSGYGIGLGDHGGWWGHDGDIFGYTTAVMHSYDTNTTIIVVVNSDIANPGDPAPSVFAALSQALP